MRADPGPGKGRGGLARIEVHMGRQGMDSRVTIDGLDISHAVNAVRVESESYGGMPVVVLRLMGDTTVEIEGPR